MISVRGFLGSNRVRSNYAATMGAIAAGGEAGFPAGDWLGLSTDSLVRGDDNYDRRWTEDNLGVDTVTIDIGGGKARITGTEAGNAEFLLRTKAPDIAGEFYVVANAELVSGGGGIQNRQFGLLFPVLSDNTGVLWYNNVATGGFHIVSLLPKGQVFVSIATGDVAFRSRRIADDTVYVDYKLASGGGWINLDSQVMAGGAGSVFKGSLYMVAESGTLAVDWLDFDITDKGDGTGSKILIPEV